MGGLDRRDLILAKRGDDRMEISVSVLHPTAAIVPRDKQEKGEERSKTFWIPPFSVLLFLSRYACSATVKVAGPDARDYTRSARPCGELPASRASRSAIVLIASTIRSVSRSTVGSTA